ARAPSSSLDRAQVVRAHASRERAKGGEDSALRFDPHSPRPVSPELPGFKPVRVCGAMRTVTRSSLLAGRAVPSAATGYARLLDRGSTAIAGLAAPAVHLELVLHPAGGAVRLAVVAERRSLPSDAGPERCADAAVQGRDVGVGQLARR